MARHEEKRRRIAVGCWSRCAVAETWRREAFKLKIPTVSKTDERLRSWLDTNQLARERLCQAILSLDSRFHEVRPRNPRGGPDGGRDLEAIFHDGREVWAAIGFQNSVSDSPHNKKQASKKYHADLKRALEEKSDLKVFVFFCNVALTADEKSALAKHARKQGIEETDVFDRERIRIVLDSPEGRSIRFQYLDLELSSALLFRASPTGERLASSATAGTFTLRREIANAIWP
jgi:hypothetical protein